MPQSCLEVLKDHYAHIIQFIMEQKGANLVASASAMAGLLVSLYTIGQSGLRRVIRIIAAMTCALTGLMVVKSTELRAGISKLSPCFAVITVPSEKEYLLRKVKPDGSLGERNWQTLPPADAPLKSPGTIPVKERRQCRSEQFCASRCVKDETAGRCVWKYSCLDLGPVC